MLWSGKDINAPAGGFSNTSVRRTAPPGLVRSQFVLDKDYIESRQGEGRCSRCGEERLRAWYELSEEEREVVKRLPASGELALEERAARHRWCPNCWNEETTERASDA